MKILIHLAHPAHYHLFKHIVNKLLTDHEVHVSYNEKDVLKMLIDRAEVPAHWHEVAVSNGGGGKYAFVRQFAEKEIGFFKLAKAIRPDVLVGTPIVIAHTGWLLSIPSIIVNEDDFDVISSSTTIGYPFASVILAPTRCSHSKWGHKTVHYDGYHELAYLSRKYFTPDRAVVEKYLRSMEKYFILRFSSLSAHHDIGKSGLPSSLALDVIKILENHGRVYVNSERQLDANLESYRLPVHPRDMHHLLYYADLYIGDSQTMAAEAAVLGTPSIRFNDFVGRLGYLEELEHEYGLTIGIKTSEQNKLMNTINDYLNESGPRAAWRDRALSMQKEKIDVVQYFAEFITAYSA